MSKDERETEREMQRETDGSKCPQKLLSLEAVTLSGSGQSWQACHRVRLVRRNVLKSRQPHLPHEQFQPSNGDCQRSKD